MKTKTEVMKFSIIVEELVKEHKIGYIDAVCHYCDRTGVELEVAAKLLSPPLKAKLREEAEDLNLIRKGSKLF
jgi:predicted methyltransferase